LPGKAKGTYLVEQFSIALVPLPRLFGDPMDPPEQESPRPSFLLVGDIDYVGESASTSVGESVPSSESRQAATYQATSLPKFAPLVGTRDEIIMARRHFTAEFPFGQCTLLSGAQATEEAFRQQAPRHRYLHLATHGYFASTETRSFLEPLLERAVAD